MKLMYVPSFNETVFVKKFCSLKYCHTMLETPAYDQQLA